MALNHYREAQRLLQRTADAIATWDTLSEHEVPAPEVVAVQTAAAQAHATLALVAAHAGVPPDYAFEPTTLED